MDDLAPNRIGIINIEPLGRASSVFFQGLLDGHPEILTLPLGVLEQDFKATPDSLLSGLERSVREYGPGVDLNRAAFLSAANAHLTKYGSPLLALYRGYAAAIGREVSGVRWLCYHAHSFEVSLKLLREFPALRTIFLIRDPRASYASMKKRGDLNPYLQHRRFVTLYKYFFKRLGGKALLLRHEDIHLRFETVIRRLLDFMGIADNASLRESSYFSVPYTGQKQAFSSTNGIYSNRPDPRYVNDEWKNILSPAELAFIERTSRELMAECGYDISTDSVKGTDFDYSQLRIRRRWAVALNVIAGIKDEMLVRLHCARLGRQ